MKVSRKTKNFEGLKSRIEKLSKSKVRSGYFKGGVHSTSGLPYSDMMTIHEYGMYGNKARPVRSLTLLELKSKHVRSIEKDIEKYLISGGDTKNLLQGIGITITNQAQEIFGSSKWLTVTSNPTPLIDTGELKINWTWDIVLD